MKTEKFINPRIEKLTPFIVMEILERANEMTSRGIDVIHLEVGEPDFDPPECVTEAVRRSLSSGETHYTHSLGMRELREAIAYFYISEYDVEVNPECIAVTSGSSPAILLALNALCNEGDEVVISNPGYSCYKNFIYSAGAVPVEVNVSAANGFQYEKKSFESVITDKTRAVFLNSPMNPSGVLASDKTFEMLAESGITVISDEIYHGLVYGSRARSMLEFSRDSIIINGFSKRFAMTGLRLGYLIVPEKLIRSVQILQQNLFICAPSIAQRSGIAALQCAGDDVRKMVSVYDERRKYMLSRLEKIGFSVSAEPMGAFYIFCDARKFTNDSYSFALEILDNAYVGITPGVDFGTNGEGFVRFSYANSMERIKEGMDRIEKYLSSRKK